MLEEKAALRPDYTSPKRAYRSSLSLVGIPFSYLNSQKDGFRLKIPAIVARQGLPARSGSTARKKTTVYTNSRSRKRATKPHFRESFLPRPYLFLDSPETHKPRVHLVLEILSSFRFGGGKRKQVHYLNRPNFRQYLRARVVAEKLGRVSRFSTPLRRISKRYLRMVKKLKPKPRARNLFVRDRRATPKVPKRTRLLGRRGVRRRQSRILTYRLARSLRARSLTT